MHFKRLKRSGRGAILSCIALIALISRGRAEGEGERTEFVSKKAHFTDYQVASPLVLCIRCAMSGADTGGASDQG